MRPITALLQLNAADALISDTGAVDWTAAGSKLGTLQFQTGSPWMDDREQLSISSDNLIVPAGIWRVTMGVHVVNGPTGGAAHDVILALTNGDGTTVHNESDELTIPDDSDRYFELFSIVHLTADAEFAFRAVQNTATPDLTVQPAQIALVEKIGNVYED